MKNWLKFGLLMFGMLAARSASAVTLISETAGTFKSDKVVELTSEVNEDSLAKFTKQMKATKDLPGDRIVLINSPGGSVEDGLKMITQLEAEHKAGTRIVCYNIHNAHSMAFNLMTHCDVRLGHKNSIYLVHKIATYLNCQDDKIPFRCTANVFRRMADDLDREDEQFREANAKAMSLSLKDYDLLADNETMWRAKELLKRGYLHSYATLEK